MHDDGEMSGPRCSPLHKQLYTVSTGIDTWGTDLCGFDKRP